MCNFYMAYITEKCQLFVFYYIQKLNFCVMDWLTPCHLNWLFKLRFTIISNSQFCMHSNFCVMDWLVLCHLNWLLNLRFTIISSQFCMHAWQSHYIYINFFRFVMSSFHAHWLVPCHLNCFLKLRFTIISSSQFCTHAWKSHYIYINFFRFVMSSLHAL